MVYMYSNFPNTFSIVHRVINRIPSRILSQIIDRLRSDFRYNILCIVLRSVCIKKIIFDLNDLNRS